METGQICFRLATMGTPSLIFLIELVSIKYSYHVTLNDCSTYSEDRKLLGQKSLPRENKTRTQMITTQNVGGVV